MHHRSAEMPDERPSDLVCTGPTKQHPKRPVVDQASVVRRVPQAQTVVLAYLGVLLVLGVIALLRAPGTTIPQVVVSLHSWLRM